MSAVRGLQTAENAQEGRLAATVRAVDLDDLPGRDVDRKALEQQPVPAKARQADGLQKRIAGAVVLRGWHRKILECGSNRPARIIRAELPGASRPRARAWDGRGRPARNTPEAWVFRAPCPVAMTKARACRDGLRQPIFTTMSCDRAGLRPDFADFRV